MVWTEAVRKLIPYKQPHFASVEKLKYISTTDLYLAVGFVGFGRQDYMVQHGSKFYFHQTIADFRREEIIFKRLKTTKNSRKERHPNVFKNWRIDNVEMVEQCVKHDI